MIVSTCPQAAGVAGFLHWLLRRVVFTQVLARTEIPRELGGGVVLVERVGGALLVVGGGGGVRGGYT